MNTQQESLALAVMEEDRGVQPSSSGIPGQITDTLRKAMERGHLISPAAACPTLPPGCEVAVSAVLVEKDRETYTVQGGHALSKVALERISKAVGVSWHPTLSHRTDNGDDPCFASYKAVGHFRDFDGTWRTIEGEKQMDLRDGSERAKTMKSGELSEARKFIAEHAQTKARLRAIRSLGIRASYNDAELKKPFVCARLVFTGQSDDPDIRREFARVTAQAMTQGSEMLYGAVDQNRPALPPHEQEAEGNGRGPLESVAAESAKQTEPEVKQCTPTHCFAADPAASHVTACYGGPANVPTEKAPAPTAPTGEPEKAAWKITRGSAKGLAVDDRRVTVETLKELRNYYLTELDPNGPDFSKMDPERIDLLSGELREVVGELRRRGIKD